MSREWDRDFADEACTPRKEQRRPPTGRKRTRMRKSEVFPHKGITTPEIACLVIALFVISLLTLLYTSLLVSPAILRAAVKDLVCDPMVKSTSTQAMHSQMHTKGPGPITAPPNAVNSSTVQVGSQVQKISILLVVFLLGSKVERRSLLRVAYGVQLTDHADVTLKFVVGKPQGEEETLTIGLESLRFDDILVLNCEENMNHGKSFTFFSALVTLGIRYDYVMKTDDDSYVRLDNLARFLVKQPRNGLYYGYVLPCDNDNAYSGNMAGVGYVISWDLVLWVHDAAMPRNHTDGTEEHPMAEWLNAGNRVKNRVRKKPLFYDHPESGGVKCAHELIPDTILIDQVKTPARWHQVLTFFEQHRMADILSIYYP